MRLLEGPQTDAGGAVGHGEQGRGLSLPSTRLKVEIFKYITRRFLSSVQRLDFEVFVPDF